MHRRFPDQHCIGSGLKEVVRQADIRSPWSWTTATPTGTPTTSASGLRAWYLIDADGFVRYEHFGEGAYGETEEKIRELLAEKERISN